MAKRKDKRLAAQYSRKLKIEQNELH